MTFESVNSIYGRTKNPYHPERTTGGSTGGESGLIATRSSPVGLGSDLGGSVRIPCEFCGIYGFKATAERISMKGHTPYTPSFDG